MITMDFLKTFPTRGSYPWMVFNGWLWSGMAKTTKTRFFCENVPDKNGGPYLFASNSSHNYDLLGFRYELRMQGIEALTVSKGKNYHAPLLRHLSCVMGSLPFTSKGYILTMDFKQQHGRRPSDEEYRALRALVDEGSDRGSRPASIDPLLKTPREVLGAHFDPTDQSYSQFVWTLYEDMMQESLRLARAALAQGWHIHIFPQGSVSSRLSKGRIGAVQLAEALDLTIVPVGLNGFREAFKNPRSMRLCGGDVKIRFGEPYKPAPLPEDFECFRVDSERKHRALLETRTQTLMDRINPLLDPKYRWSTDRESDGKAGAARFV